MPPRENGNVFSLPTPSFERDVIDQLNSSILTCPPRPVDWRAFPIAAGQDRSRDGVAVSPLTVSRPAAPAISLLNRVGISSAFSLQTVTSVKRQFDRDPSTDARRTDQYPQRVGRCLSIPGALCDSC